MQARFIALLRDPIWQAIGAVASIVAVFFTLPSNLFSTGEFLVVRVLNYPPTAFLPKEDFAVNQRSSGKEVSSLFADYFIVSNNTGRVLQQDQFKQPITVTPKSGRILLVRPCEEGFRISTGLGVVDWQAPSIVTPDGTTWIVNIPLMNRGENACFAVFTQDATISPPDSQRVDVRARVVDASVFVGQSIFDRQPTQGFLSAILGIGVSISGPILYAVFILHGALFVLNYFLAARIGLLTNSRWRSALLLAALSAISLATAEFWLSLRDVPLATQHPAAWIMLIFQLSFVAYVVFKSRGRFQATAGEV